MDSELYRLVRSLKKLILEIVEDVEIVIFSTGVENSSTLAEDLSMLARYSLVFESNTEDQVYGGMKVIGVLQRMVD